MSEAIATHFARSGWPVFPLIPGGKKPLAGSRGCHDASTSIEQISQWWRAHPDANVGIATGRRSGLLVIDVDPRKDASWLDALNSLKLPQTFTVRTASGGFHLYFDYAFGRSQPRISIGADLLPGIDWRGEGGYVVAPGSIVAGSHYEIARPEAIAKAPASLIAALTATRATKTPERKQDGRMVIRHGGRNSRLCSIAGALRRYGCEDSVLLQCLRAINAEHCAPPLPERDLAGIAASVGRYQPQGAA